jgi:DNA processing protein
MEPEASLSWLALTLTPGIAARLSSRLLHEFGTPEGVFRASLTALEACNLPAPAAQAIFREQTFWRAEKEVDAVRRIGCRILNCTEPDYPQSLLEIYDPPVLLYVRGDASILNVPSLSIVGTRRPTVYGSQMAERMGRDLAKRGLAIISGLARGVDAIAHLGATPVAGRAIGVLGTGIDYGAAGDGIWA